MPRLIALIAAGILALSAHAVAQAQPAGTTPEQAAKARELAMKGAAFFELLKQPTKCGIPASIPVPKGYACALVLYKDVSEEKDHDRLPELLTARVTGLTNADGAARGARVRVLSPFDARPTTVSPLQMTRMRLSITSDRRGAEFATLEMEGLLGYAENEALPAGDPRKIDTKRFKLPR
ncbi:MAG TPA: hypothetical protein VGO52_18765 [Hyphomonadaceae bacterium]|jgi:hypothetical protein|nr:hypothetical protein [Hyphomonadaceae bacterium]